MGESQRMAYAKAKSERELLRQFKKDFPEEYARKLALAKQGIDTSFDSVEGVIVAWRGWKVVLTEDGFRLGSPGGYSSILSPYEINEAKCSNNPTHNPPEKKCGCGFYGVKNEVRSQGYILGKTYLWGKFIEHEVGWRAQYAYPKSISRFRCCVCSEIGLLSTSRGYIQLFMFTKPSIALVHSVCIPTLIPESMSLSGSYILEQLENTYGLEVESDELG